MFVKLLVLGRPGSGKTTASQYIKKRAEENGWLVNRSRDYNFLHDMFTHDVEQRRFRPVEHGGFEIVDFSVLDEALLHLKKQIMLHTFFTTRKEILIVEFARDDYGRAFEILGAEFLSDTNILFIDADVDICIERIHQRIFPVLAPDKHFISDSVLKGYYGKDNSTYMRLLAEIGTYNKLIEESTRGVIQYIENIGSLRYFYTNVDHFYDEVMSSCIFSMHSDQVSILQRS